MNARRNLMLVLLAAAAVAGCATEATRLDAQWVNPQFAGQRAVRSLMVMGVSRDASTRRLYEDRMVASLGAAGVRAVQAYLTLPDDGPIPEDRLHRAVRAADVSHVIVSRIVNVTQQVNVTPGTVTTTAWGPRSRLGTGIGMGPRLARLPRPPQLDVGTDDDIDAAAHHDVAGRERRHAAVRLAATPRCSGPRRRRRRSARRRRRCRRSSISSSGSSWRR